MVKNYNVLVKFTNNSGFDLIHIGDWYDSGRVADGFSWPAIVTDGDHCQVLNYERDWSLAGCSGYVQYKMGKSTTVVTIAFSNPNVFTNKLGVGITGPKVWDDMENHGNNEFVEQISVGDVVLYFRCQCTSGKMNTATVDILKTPSR